jgi:hypothetical protein
MVFNLFGALSSRHNDLDALRDSDLNARLRNAQLAALGILPNPNLPPPVPPVNAGPAQRAPVPHVDVPLWVRLYCMYGDGIFPVMQCLKSKHKSHANVPLTQRELLENSGMYFVACYYICVVYVLMCCRIVVCYGDRYDKCAGEC